MRSRANPWWRSPRKRDLPKDGEQVIVVLDPAMFGETKPIMAIVRVMDGIWRTYEADASYRVPHEIKDGSMLPFVLEAEDEGITWCLGWDTSAAHALLAAQALL